MRAAVAIISALALLLAAAGTAQAKPARLTTKAVKVSAVGGVGSVKLSGSATFSKKVKTAKVTIKIVSGALPAQKLSAKATSKKPAKSLKFTATVATAFVGPVKVTATVLKKNSKTVTAIVSAPSGGGSNPGGGSTTPPPSGENPPPAEALGLTSIEIATSLTCGMIGGAAYCGGANGTFNPTGANPGAASVAGLARVGGALASGSVSSVDAGEEFACGVKAAEAYCWGRNYEGQLGIGDNASGHEWSETPVKPSLPAGAVSQVSAGDTQACAIVAGAVYCWGYASHGQVGNGATTGYVLAPVAVAGMTGVSRIVALDTATCAIKSGDLYCWGYNKNNRFGTGKTEDADYTTPTLVGGLPSGTVVTDVAVGDSNSCVLTSEGHVYCWGADSFGELGNGDPTAESITPVTPTGLDSGVTSLSGSFYHFCAVKSGAAYCWGNDWQGQLGVGAGASERHAPVAVTGLGSGVASISAGTWSTCAVMAATSGYCWGKGTAYQLVNGSNGNTSTPSAVIKITFT